MYCVWQNSNPGGVLYGRYIKLDVRDSVFDSNYAVPSSMLYLVGAHGGEMRNITSRNQNCGRTNCRASAQSIISVTGYLPWYCPLGKYMPAVGDYAAANSERERLLLGQSGGDFV